MLAQTKRHESGDDGISHKPPREITVFPPLTNVPAADDEYPSVFLALLTNRHRGVSGADNFFAVCDDVSPVASSVIFTAETSAQIAEIE
jgi:hypothetical protein